MSRNLPVRRGRSAAALASVIQKRSVARPVNLNALFKVYLLDDSFKILQLSETSTILDVIVDLKFKLELNDASNFAVFLETDSFERLELDTKAHTLPVFDYSVTGFRYVFCSWVVDIHGVFYSKALFDIEQSVEKHDSSMELYLAYIEANYSIMKTNKWKLLEEDAIYLGCLHLQICAGDYNVVTHTQDYMQNKVANTFPSPIKERFLSFLMLYEEKNGRYGTKKDDKKEQNSILDAQKAEFLGKITRQYERLQGIDKVTAQYRFVRYLTLMTPYYGCSEFSDCTVQFMRQVANVTNESETSEVNNNSIAATNILPVEMQEFYPYNEEQCDVSVCVSFIQLTPKKLSEKNGKSDKNLTNNSTNNSNINIIKHLYSRIIHYVISADNALLTYYVLKNTVSLQDFEEIYSETEEISFNYQTYCDCIQLTCDNPDATADNNCKTTVKMAELRHLFSTYYHLQRDGVRPCLPYAVDELLSPLDIHNASTADDTAINSNNSNNKVASTMAIDKHKRLHHNKYVTATNKNIALSYVHIRPSMLVSTASSQPATTAAINANDAANNSINSGTLNSISDLSSETVAKLHISGPSEQQPTTTTGIATTTVTTTCSTEESVVTVDIVSNFTFDTTEGATTNTATDGATVSANENPTADHSTEKSAEQPTPLSRPVQVLSKRVTKAQQLLVELKEKQEKQREKKQELLLKQKALGIDILYDKSDVLTTASGTDTTSSESHSTISNNSNQKPTKISSDSLLQIETLNFNGESDQILPSLNSTRAIRRSFRRGSVFHVQSNPSKVQNNSSNNNNNNNNNNSDNGTGGGNSNSNSRPTSINIINISGITSSNNSSTNSSRNNSIVNGISGNSNSNGVGNNSGTNNNSNSEKSSPIKYENLSNAKLITENNMTELCAKLKECSSNEEMLSKLEIEKVPFLFTSDSLAVLLELTPSVKTRIAIILTVAPRLVDPKVKIDYFLNLFRYADEKAQVEEVFKSRIQTINGSLFIRGESGNSPIRPVLGSGRGGRGRGLRPALSPVNRGSGNTSPTSPSNNNSGGKSNVFAESAEENQQSATNGTASTTNTTITTSTTSTTERSKSRIGELISNKKSALNTNAASENSEN